MINQTPGQILDKAFKNSTKISRIKIVEATLELAKKGKLISLRKIALEANCSPPSIYYYFKNKKEIMTDLFVMLFVDNNEINFDDMSVYFNDHINVFNAMFNSGETNIDVNPFIRSKPEFDHIGNMIGAFILKGAQKNDEDSHQLKQIPF